MGTLRAGLSINAAAVRAQDRDRELTRRVADAQAVLADVVDGRLELSHRAFDQRQGD